MQILFKSKDISFPIWEGETTEAAEALEHKARFFQTNYGLHISKPSPNVIDLSYFPFGKEKQRFGSLVVSE